MHRVIFTLRSRSHDALIIVVPAFEQDAAANEMLKIIAMLFAATFAVLLVVINLVLPRQNP